MYTAQAEHQPTRTRNDAISALAAEPEPHRSHPVPMCHFKRMAFDSGDDPCGGWYECRVCGHTEDSQQAWDKTWTLHYRRHARPSALVERYAARVRAWKESTEAGAVNLNVAYYFGRRAREGGRGWLHCARMSYEGQRAARLGYVDAARSLMHLRTEWVGEFGTGLTMTKPY
jgi:hypothetical protein